MSQSLSRIRKYPVFVPFALNIVSGVVKDGSLIVSWNSGVPATEQIDYGIGDDTVPNTTPWTLLKPGEKGYVEGEERKKYQTNHIIPFPETFVDTTHFFRVRSESKRRETLESEVYRVYVTEKVIRRSYVADVQVRVEPVSMLEASQTAQHEMSSDPELNVESEFVMERGVQSNPSNQSEVVAGENQPVKSNFETNITTTIS